MRMAPRLLTLLPFTAGPAMLRFHPAFSGTLLLASASGIFSLADAQGSSQYAQTYQVITTGPAACSASDVFTHVNRGVLTASPFVLRWTWRGTAWWLAAWHQQGRRSPLAAAAAMCTCGRCRTSPASTHIQRFVIAAAPLWYCMCRRTMELWCAWTLTAPCLLVTPAAFGGTFSDATACGAANRTRLFRPGRGTLP